MKQWRIRIITGLFFLVAILLVARLWYLQVFQGALYQAQALGEQQGFQENIGARGQIFLANSAKASSQQSQKSLAIDEDKWIISAVPNQVKDKAKDAQSLASILGQPATAIAAKISSGSYVVLEINASAAQVQAVKKLALAGVSVQAQDHRYYPQGDFASQLVGFVGGDGKGQYGLEGYYDQELAGKSGIAEQPGLLDIAGAASSASDLDGSDLYLTIDYNIQFEAEALLKEAQQSIDINSGQIIVMDPNTGAILALANYPSFDPNQYSAEKNYAVFQDAAVQQLFEPGSIFKPFTMAMALNEGKVSPNQSFYDPGHVTVDGHTLYNFDHKSYKNTDMSGILEKSINVGAVFLEQQIPHQTFLDYVDKFGLDKKSGVDLQGEVAAEHPLAEANNVDFATAAFGQGIAMTPLQLAAGMCAIANGGRVPKPYVVQKIVHGDEEEDTKPQLSSPVISSQTASEVTEMMVNVVNRGFGSGARIDHYYLAGKTGTAQVPLPNGRGYEPDNITIQSFVGFGPALHPKFLILVKFDDPKVSESSLSAAPYFRKMAQYIIDYWQIPPDF